MNRLIKYFAVFRFLSLLTLATPVRAANTSPSATIIPALVSFQETASGLTKPIFITNAGDGSGRIFFVEKAGRILIQKNGIILATPFLDIRSIVKTTGSEQGLLALAFDPLYAANGNFYVVYTAPRSGDSNGSNLVLRRFSVSASDPDQADPGSGAILLTISHPTYSNHNGGTLAFGQDGYLYWSTGDGGGAGDPNNNAQKLSSLLGKILRLDVNSGSPYAIPPDNPFFNSSNSSVRKEIWAFGLRNPWRFSFDRLTDDMYIGDVGQSRWEEINFEPASSSGGKNYGWRIMEGSQCYGPVKGCSTSGKMLPIAEYSHSIGCSVTGGYVYRGTAYPALSGHYFYADFCTGMVFSLHNTSSSWSATQIADQPYYISTFGEDEAGNVYLADYVSGKIYQIVYEGLGVTSITRADPNPTNASLVHFAVTFSENVTGVDTSDFTLTTSGVSGAAVHEISGAQPGSTYLVTVSTGTGNGTIRLDAVDDDSIMNGESFPMGGAGPANGIFTDGEIFNVINLGTWPIHNGYAPTSTPTFVWRAVTGALEYQIQVDHTNSFITPVVDHSQAGGTRFVSQALDYGPYFWRMRVRTAAGWMVWSQAWKFTLTPPLTKPPIPISPASAAMLSNHTPTLTWQMVMEDDRYEVQIDNHKTFVSPDQDHVGETGESSYTAAPLSDGLYFWRVRTSNYLGVPGAWSAIRWFRIDRTPPAAPASRAPADGASVIGTPTFLWYASASAIRYQFAYDDDTDFSSPVFTSLETAALRIRPPTMAPGTYAWQVRARDPAGNWGDWSPARTITILPPIPSAPALIAPAPRSITNNHEPVFSWRVVPYGETYKLEISGSSSFSTTLQSFTGLPGELAYTATTLDAGLYYWRVRALNVDGVPGPWSAIRWFRIDRIPPAAPASRAPADGASVIGTPTFLWYASASAIRYQFAYDDDIDFSSPVFTSPETAALRIRPPTMAPGTYAWQVRARDPAGNWGDWSPARTVTIISPVPGIPNLASPPSGTISQDPSPTLNWNISDNAANYRIQIDNNSTFSSPEFDSNTPLTEYTPVGLPDGVYYWRVMALNNLDGANTWSMAWRLTIRQPIPAVPALLLPADMYMEASGFPTFSWTSASNGTDYQIQVDDNADFSSPVFDDTDATTSRTAGTPLSDGNYYWRVRAINPFATPGDWSASRGLTISIPPLAPVLITPEDNATDTTGMPNFAWETVNNGITYQIQVDDDADFSSPAFDDTAGTTGRSPGTPLADGTYFWRVRALNILDHPGDWSEEWTLQISVPPAIPSLLPGERASSAPGLRIAPGNMDSLRIKLRPI